MNNVMGWSWSEMTQDGIVTINDGEKIQAYRFTDKRDCDNTRLQDKYLAQDDIFVTPLG